VKRFVSNYLNSRRREKGSEVRPEEKKKKKKKKKLKRNLKTQNCRFHEMKLSETTCMSHGS